MTQMTTCDLHNATIARLSDEVAALTRELAAERERADRNQEDAERYRWLRQYPICLRMWAWTEKLLEKLDAAIDAARRK